MDIRSHINGYALVYPVAISVAAIGYIRGGVDTAFLGFLIGLYGWFVFRLLVRFIQAIRVEEAAEFQALIFNDNEPALPMTAMGVAIASAYSLLTSGHTTIPTATSAWVWWQYPIVFVGFLVWFALIALLFTFATLALGDAFRRALGKETLPW